MGRVAVGWLRGLWKGVWGAGAIRSVQDTVRMAVCEML